MTLAGRNSFTFGSRPPAAGTEEQASMTDRDDLLTQSVLLREVADPRNHPAWKAFCQRYQPLIRRWCRQQGVSPAETEELSQDVLVKLVRKMPDYHYDRARGRFRDWLRQVVRNHVTDHRRTGSRRLCPRCLWRIGRTLRAWSNWRSWPAKCAGFWSRPKRSSAGCARACASRATGRPTTRRPSWNAPPGTWRGSWG